MEVEVTHTTGLPAIKTRLAGDPAGSGVHALGLARSSYASRMYVAQLQRVRAMRSLGLNPSLTVGSDKRSVTDLGRALATQVLGPSLAWLRV